MIRPFEELMESLRSRIGEDTSDEALALLEDVSDTLGDLKTKAEDTTNWQQKYQENDSQWRKKYHDRFFSSEASDEDPLEEAEPKPSIIKFEDLFTEEG